MHLLSHLKTKAVIILTLIAISFSAYAQAPNLLNYQGVARNSVGNPLPNQSMNLRLSVHNLSAAGTVVYSETRVIKTNLGGLFSVQVGSAGTTSASGTIGGVSWLTGDKYLQVEIDPASNSNYLNLGTVQLVSVPYAFNAVTAANALTVTTNANLTGAVTSNGNLTSLAASPALTGVPTAPTAAPGTNTAQIATTEFVKAAALTGPTGAKGVQGLAGADGAVGAQGIQGLAGAAGAQGIQGIQGVTGSVANVAAISGTSTANGASITSGVLSLAPADATNGGIVTTGAQIFAGDKTFNNTITGSISGNAATANTATKLSTPRNINGVAFDGSGDITITSSADAGALTGIIPVAKGGTGQTTVNGILTTLGFLGNNIAIGQQAGSIDLGVNANTIAIGGGAGNTSQGQSAISIGYVAGYQNQGIGSLAIGGNAAQVGQSDFAVALGAAAGQINQGENAVAIGKFAGGANQGENAVAIGKFAGHNNQLANSIAINASGINLAATNAGFYVNPVRAAATTPDLLFYNSTTKEITSTAGGIITTGAQTFTGDKTFSDLINGISVGAYLGVSNTMLGNNAFSNSTPGVNNTALGYKALSNASGGNDNTAIGANALSGRGSASANGWRNTAVGVDALKNGGGGADNVAIGFLTLPNTTGGANTAVGMYALLSNTSATANVAVGAYAQYGTTVGENNTSIGTASMALNSSGAQNTVMGANAIEKNILGSNNTVLGFSAGKYFSNLVSPSTENSNVNNSVLIGASSRTLALNSINEVVIGYNAVGNGSNTIQLGNSAITNVKTIGTITAGVVTYPNAHGTDGQVLTTTGSGTLSWTTVQAITSGTTTGDMLYWNGSAWVKVAAGTNGQTLSFSNGAPTWVYNYSFVPTVTSTGGRIWMDRNLGATQVASSSSDALSYGDLYQWGRATDGHQIRTSGTTASLSSTDAPGHGSFITINSLPNDWRSPQNGTLWQGVNGINNPCPIEYRLPTDAEWNTERLSWSSNNATGAYASPLKLTKAGYRLLTNGSINVAGSEGYYWSSTFNNANSYSFRLLIYDNVSAAATGNDYQGYGYSVRCIKN